MRKVRKSAKSKFSQALSEAEKKINEEQIAVLSGEIRKVLVARRDAIQEIKSAQRKLKVLDKDLKDFMAGKIEKIRERREKDRDSQLYSKLDLGVIEPVMNAMRVQNLNCTVPALTTTTGALPDIAGSTVYLSALNRAASQLDQNFAGVQQ